MPISPAAHHWLWLRLACDDRISKLLIISPPESAKTTWLISAYLGCRVGFYPEQNIIIASVSDDVAVARSLALRTLVEGAMWRHLFPGVVRAQGLKWEQDKWSLAPDGRPHSGRLHPTVSAYGTGASITGSRADLLLGDDLLDLDNTRTVTQRRYISEWGHTSFLSRRKSRTGRTIIIGTSWNADDFYADIRKAPQGWVICHTPLLSTQSDGFYAYITYPDDWPYERLGVAGSGTNA